MAATQLVRRFKMMKSMPFKMLRLASCEPNELLKSLDLFLLAFFDKITLFTSASQLPMMSNFYLLPKQKLTSSKSSIAMPKSSFQRTVKSPIKYKNM